MMTKFFEIRDRETFIPVLAIQLKMGASQSPDEEWLLGRAGYDWADIRSGQFVLLITLSAGVGMAICDPYDWASSTFTPAHAYIAEHWDDLLPGQVIDAEFIRGESASPKVSERHSVHG